MITRRTLAMAAAANNKPIRAAIYGVGHAHARGKVEAMRTLPEFELVGVCEPDPSVPRTHEAVQGVRWPSEKEVLDDLIEFIAVESRVQQNLLYARRAINAGKFVHLDKAHGDDLVKFRDLLAEATRIGPYPAGRKDHSFPPDTLPGFAPDMLEMARVIREGAKPSYSAEHDLMTQEVLLRVCGYKV